MTNKTKKYLFIALLILSIISVGAIQLIDSHLIENSDLEIQELSQAKDQVILKFNFCMGILESIAEIVSSRF